MRVVYRVIAYVIAAEVVLQASFMAYAVFGLGKWIDDGGVLDSAVIESDKMAFDEEVGFMLHGINGQMVIPALALIFLIVSFFAKVKGGVLYAVMALVWVAVQITLGLSGHEIPVLGLFHGIVAFALFGTAFMAGVRAKRPALAPVGGDAAL
ncbi:MULTISPECIES: hypothetical protein [Glycomyces]|uniref:Uncharacterized protein n=2 Tax=Glycomyces TaxID=58113 RepID=A0ABU2ATD7_9ACTN|nr:hypothetical protein [Glycomyces lechevalierae]MDR7340476.1 hypothetical protein [Glycomyces lechevalierae]